MLALIKEQAEEGRTIQYLTNTVKQMEKDGFRKRPLYGLFVAEAENKIIGSVIYIITYAAYVGKCVYIEELVVDKQYRQKGIGKKLFEKVILLSKHENAKIMSWQNRKENLFAVGLYKKFNANFDTEFINCSLTEEQIKSYKEE